MEVLQKPQDKDLTKCPECHQESLERKVSAPRFRLGGTGWYETDEKPKSKQRNIAKKDSSSGSDQGSGSKTSTGSKSTSD